VNAFIRNKSRRKRRIKWKTNTQYVGKNHKEVQDRAQKADVDNEKINTR
jgi:hypothetical protein